MGESARRDRIINAYIGMEKRLSQLPEFRMQDSGPDIYVCGEAVSTEQLLAEGAEYTKLILDEVQYVETRTHHHLH